MKNLSFRLKSLRGSRSQAAISNILGVKQQNWARWESGVVQPNAFVLRFMSLPTGFLAYLTSRRKLGRPTVQQS